MPRVSKSSQKTDLPPFLLQAAAEQQAIANKHAEEYLKKKTALKAKKLEPIEESELVPEKVKKVRIKKVTPKMVDSSGSDNSNDDSAVTSTEKKNNKWLEHIRSYRQSNPDVSYKEALKLAKESYSR